MEFEKYSGRFSVNFLVEISPEFYRNLAGFPLASLPGCLEFRWNTAGIPLELRQNTTGISPEYH